MSLYDNLPVELCLTFGGQEVTEVSDQSKNRRADVVEWRIMFEYLVGPENIPKESFV